MPIKLRLDEPGAFAVGPSPGMEAVLSLHVLTHAKSHPVQHPWIRRMRSLSPGLKREIRLFRFLYDDAIPDCFIPGEAEERVTFEEGLAAFEALAPERAAYVLARPAFFYSVPDAHTETLDGDLARGRFRKYVVKFGPESQRAAEQFLSDPAAVQARFAAMMSEYWKESFGEEWGRLEPALEADGAGAGREFAADPFAFLGRFAPQVRIDRAERLVIRPSPHEHEVGVTAARPLRLVPSVYVWPNVRVNCDEPWPLLFVYPVAAVSREAAVEPVPTALVQALRAASDPARLQILRLLARAPRSTEELAPLVGLSESGLSKHLRALTDAGLATTKRQGWYVLYSVDRERLDQLGTELLDYLEQRP